MPSGRQILDQMMDPSPSLRYPYNRPCDNSCCLLSFGGSFVLLLLVVFFVWGLSNLKISNKLTTKKRLNKESFSENTKQTDNNFRLEAQKNSKLSGSSQNSPKMLLWKLVLWTAVFDYFCTYSAKRELCCSPGYLLFFWNI